MFNCGVRVIILVNNYVQQLLRFDLVICLYQMCNAKFIFNRHICQEVEFNKFKKKQLKPKVLMKDGSF